MLRYTYVAYLVLRAPAKSNLARNTVSDLDSKIKEVLLFHDVSTRRKLFQKNGCMEGTYFTWKIQAE